MNAASLATLRLAAELLDSTGCANSSTRVQVRTAIEQNEWRVLQTNYHARQRLATPEPPPPVVTHHAGSETPINGHQTQCAVCKRYFDGPPRDCFSFEAPHAAGVALVVCAPCVFGELCRTEPPRSLAHAVATVYRK